MNDDDVKREIEFMINNRKQLNDKLKDIAKQAQVEHCISHERLRDFADLIVKECIKESMEEIVADEEIAQEKDPLTREYLLGNNQGIVDAVVRFRNHFGVE